jgi:hypothetical protein
MTKTTSALPSFPPLAMPAVTAAAMLATRPGSRIGLVVKEEIPVTKLGTFTKPAADMARLDD